MNQNDTKRLYSVMSDLAGIEELIDALASEGRDDASALRLISRILDGAFVELEQIAESIKRN